MNLDKTRHCFYMLGNTQKEQLDNCNLYDSIKSSMEKIAELKNLIDKCNSEKNVSYVKRMLNIKD